MKFINEMRRDDSDFKTAGLVRVIDWNLAARGCHEFSDKDIARQKSFVTEELKETMKAIIDDKNRKEVIDGICDMFVVATYWYFLDDLNGALLDADSEFLGDATSMEYAFGDSLMTVSDALASVRTWKDEYPGEIMGYLVRAVDSDRCHASVEQISTLMDILNFDSREALSRVLDSNDSKIPKCADLYGALADHCPQDAPTLEDVISLQEELLNAQHVGRYEGIKGKEINGRVVFKDSNGKIMKPCTFFEPDLSNL